MFIRILSGFLAFFLGSAILFTSILHSANVRYNFELEPGEERFDNKSVHISYILPYPGEIDPDDPLWPFKAARDKTWLSVARNPLRKSEISILIADKRLALGGVLVGREDYETGVATLNKGEIYLAKSYEYAMQAKKEGMEVNHIFYRIALSSLKHREILETIYTQVPEDAMPLINKINDVSKGIYQKSTHELNESGQKAPENPFD